MRRNLPIRANSTLFSLVVAFELAQLFGGWSRIWDSGVGAAAWIALAAMLTPLRTALQHESLHGKLFEGHWNRVAGRALAASQGLAWVAIRWGHWTHHRWTRHPLDQPDVAPAKASRSRAWARHFGLLFGGIYLFELAASLALWLPAHMRQRIIERVIAGTAAPMPEMRREALDLANRPDNVRAARQDLSLALLLHGTAIWMWADAWPVLLGGYAARAVVISFFDNAAHYGTQPTIGAPASDFALPKPWSWLFLNGNLHESHHQNPSAPWTELPSLRADMSTTVHVNFVRAAARQLTGPHNPQVGKQESR